MNITIDNLNTKPDILIIDKIRDNHYLNSKTILKLMIGDLTFMKKTVQPEGNYYNKYDSKHIIEKYLVNNFFNTIRKMLKNINYKNIYEIGCGEGVGSNYINNLKHNTQYIATDVSLSKIKQSSKLYPDIMFKQDSIYDIQQDSNSTNLVVCCEVLEHIENFSKGIEELFRISNKYVLISVPNEPIWRICNLMRGKYIKNLGNTPGHINHFNKKQLLKLLRPYGDIVYLQTPFPWIMILCKKR